MYVFMSSLPLSKALILAGITSIFFILNRGNFIYTMVLLPFEFISMVVASLALKSDFKEISLLIFFGMALMFLASQDIRISISGLVMLGIFLTIYKFSPPIVNFAIFFVTIVSWLILKRKLSKRTLLLLILSALFIVPFINSLDFSLLNSLGNNQEKTFQDNSTQLDDHEFRNSNLLETRINNHSYFFEKPSLTYTAFESNYLEFLISFTLIVFGLFLSFVVIKILKSKEGIRNLLLSFLYFTVLIGFLVFIFLMVKDIEYSRISLGTNSFTSNIHQIMYPDLSNNSNSVFEKKIDFGLLSFFIKALEISGIFMLSLISFYLLFYLFKFVHEFKVTNSGEKEKDIPENVKMIPLDQFPALNYTKEYIVSAYWWLRRKYFGNMNFLTPYELLDKIKKVESVDFEAFKHLTECYVLVHFGNKQISRSDFKAFDSNLRKISDSLEIVVS